LVKVATRSEGLSFGMTVAFCVGTMIGAGVFVLSGLVIDVAGPGAILSYVIGGIVVSFSGLSYAVLASIFPEDGGGYLYARRMLGPYSGFLTGWGLYAFSTIATAFVLLGFGIYLNLLLGLSLDIRGLALLALLSLVILNLRGLSESGWVEIVLVAAKVGILLLLVMVGLLSFQPSDLAPFLPRGTDGMLSGISLVFFAYTGFQVAAMMAGEVKESSKRVPQAILASIGIVIVVYVGVIIALLAADLPQYGGQSLFDAAEVFFGTVGGPLVAFAATISTITAANGNLIGGSRITMEMACEHQLPGRYARLRKGQPFNSIVLGAAITSAFILLGNLDLIVHVTNAVILVTMVLVNLSALVLVRKEEGIANGRKYFKPPLGPLFPALGIVTCVALVLLLPPLTTLLGLAVLLIGTWLYFLEDTAPGRAAVHEIQRVLGR
jgi:amino acid transporter